MKKVLVLCEGQTEQAFVIDLLDPYLKLHGKQAEPKVLTTKVTGTGKQHKGGVSKYQPIRRDALRLLGDSSAACVTTMLDYYGLPKDFPGKAGLSGHTPYRRVALLEQAFAADISNPRFLPYLVLHEFEAMLFADPNALQSVLNSNQKLLMPRGFTSPEEINEGEQTHPSARIHQQFGDDYRKALHGPRRLRASAWRAFGRDALTLTLGSKRWRVCEGWATRRIVPMARPCADGEWSCRITCMGLFGLWGTRPSAS